MGQVNIKHGNHKASPSGSSGYGFDAQGKPTITDQNGQDTPLQTQSSTPSNLIANKGVGLEADLPAGVAGDVYVTTDTFKVFTAKDSVTWGSAALVNGQFITDVSETVDLPPLYQYWNNNLMAIANKDADLPELPA
jgi:hypothetical protein